MAYEFRSVVTQPRIWRTPATMAQALGVLRTLIAAGGATPLGEGPGHLASLGEALAEHPIRGSRVFDARVAATCLEHGVRRLWSVDRDFSRFPALRVVNPLRAA